MNEEILRKIAQEEIKKQIMENLDSSIIFTYINNLEKQLEQEKEKNIADMIKDTEFSDFIKERYILKNKIRAKIEEIKNTCYYNEGDATAVEQVFILEKILEE